MNAKELIKFNQAHGAAMMTPTNDYVACRCCLLNGVLLPGFRLAAEAIEKYLKAFILYCDPTFDVEAYNHRIRKIAAEANRFEPHFNTRLFRRVFKRLETHYRRRYPDARNLPHQASGAELVEIDELVLHICDCLPIPEELKFRIYGPFCFLCRSNASQVQPYAKWLEQKNLALKRRKANLLLRYNAVERQLGENRK